MKKRRFLMPAGILAILVGLPSILWGGYVAYHASRGEHFYRGLPSSYWRGPVSRWAREEPPRLGRRLTWAPGWLDRPLAYLGLVGEPAVLSRDPRAVPVLIDLLKDMDNAVRKEAIEALGRNGLAASQAVPALLVAFEGPAISVRHRIVLALERIKPSGEEILPTVLEFVERGDADSWFAALLLFDWWKNGPAAEPLLLQALRHPDADTRMFALQQIAYCDFRVRQEAGGVLRAVQDRLHDENDGVRQVAAAVLKKIDPDAAP
jgi:HEAT repeat protein